MHDPYWDMAPRLTHAQLCPSYHSIPSSQSRFPEESQSSRSLTVVHWAGSFFFLQGELKENLAQGLDQVSKTKAQ